MSLASSLSNDDLLSQADQLRERESLGSGEHQQAELPQEPWAPAASGGITSERTFNLRHNKDQKALPST